MHDVKEQILHDANNFFFIRVVALYWTEGFGRRLSLAHGANPSLGRWFLELGQPSKASLALASYNFIVQVPHKASGLLQGAD